MGCFSHAAGFWRIAFAAMAQVEFDYPPKPAPGELWRLYPDFDHAFVKGYAAAMRYTMTSPERMYALWQAVLQVVRDGVPGDFVECGVWRGGSSMLAAHTFAQAGDTERRLWLYDTFDGMPAPSDGDVDYAGRPAADVLVGADALYAETVTARAGLEEVQAALRLIDYPQERIHFVQGLVEDTIPAQAPEQIAILRLDTDWEASTRHELEHLWPRVARGGVLIIDDYGHWAGARAAVDAYFEHRDDAPLLVRVDYSGRVGVRR
jgi:O-methyltransferase